MPQENNHTQIFTDLQAQVNATETEDVVKRARLDALSELLAADEQEPETLIEQLNETLYHFGAEHPELVAAVHRALTILGAGGI